ncbi:MAG: hypothetical protein KQ78_01204 [Candidatus Izimaplasma bacterium HR2]|nr:MAG: hypothetical protein KQ78_01204 [Candidatus Izimaplasma bacterium HR2]
MSVSNFERILLTRVDILLVKIIRKLFGWVYNPIINSCKWFLLGIKALYMDFDTWESDGMDLDDVQLFKLGLNVEKINDKEKYWTYDTRIDRHSQYNRPPSYE